MSIFNDEWPEVSQKSTQPNVPLQHSSGPLHVNANTSLLTLPSLPTIPECDYLFVGGAIASLVGTSYLVYDSCQHLRGIKARTGLTSKLNKLLDGH